MDRIDAVHQVLCTLELLENVLLQLPMQSLLHAQRVCVAWFTLIRRSLPLQRALFLAPARIEAIHPQTLYFPRGATPTYLYPHSFTRWTLSKPSKPIHFKVNPLLIKFQPDITNMWHNNPTPVLKCLFNSDFCSKEPEASWRRMCVCWPPFKTMKIDPLYIFNSSGDDIPPFEIIREEGIRISDILDEIITRAQ